MEKKLVQSILQRYGFLRSQNLELFEEEIRLVYRHGANRSSRSVPLEWIDESESEARLYPTWARWGMLLVLLAMGATLAAALEWGGLFFPVLAGLGGVLVLLAVLHQTGAYDATYFYNSFNGDFLFAMIRNSPDRESVESFVKAMRAGCKEKRKRAKMEQEIPSIATELHHLVRLREKEVISDHEFTDKKDKLIEEVLSD